MFCRFAVPFNCFRAVLFHAFSIAIAIAKIELCSCISILRRFLIPFKCLFQVFCDSYTITIAIAQFILRFWTFLFCRFGVPLYSRLIVREFRIQPPGHILGRHISLSRRRFVPLAGLFVVLFNAQSLIIEASAQNALRLGIALLCGLFVPHERIFFAFFHTRAVLIAPCHLKLCLGVSVISGRDHVLLERHFRIACLLIILGIMQVVLLGFLFRLLLRFLAQTEAFHTSHKLLLFIFRANKQEAVYSVFLSTETHSLDLSPQTIPIHTARRRFKPFNHWFFPDSIGNFHLPLIHTDGFQFIRKIYFYLDFTHF